MKKSRKEVKNGKSLESLLAWSQERYENIYHADYKRKIKVNIHTLIQYHERCGQSNILLWFIIEIKQRDFL